MTHPDKNNKKTHKRDKQHYTTRNNSQVTAIMWPSV